MKTTIKKRRKLNRNKLLLISLLLLLLIVKVLILLLVIEAGYCPYTLLNTTLERHDLFIDDGSRRPDLKQTPDDNIYIWT